MRNLFADSAYWIALFDPAEEFHSVAKTLLRKEQESRLITTDSVLVEVLNFFSAFTVIPQERELFLQALQLYKSRLDKSYSLTDCISMVVMKKEQIEDVLSSDRHFEQEGFSLLMKQ